MTEHWIADSTPSERYTIVTRANAGEVMAQPVSPLTATMLVEQSMEQGWRDAYVTAGTFRYDEFEPGRLNCLGVLGGYLYLNMSTTRIYGVRMPGMTPEMVDLQYFGDMPGITPYADEARPADEDPEATARLQQFVDWLFSRDDWPELRADRDEVDRLVAARPDLTTLSDQELVDRARSFLPLERRLFCRHIITSAASGVGIGTVAGVLQAIGRADLLTAVIAGLGDVDSAAPSWAMWDLGRLVAASRSLTAAFDAGLDGLHERVAELAGAGDEAAAAFASKLHDLQVRFGSRGPDEWDLRADTWGVAPHLVLAAVDRMRLAPDRDGPQDRSDQRAGEREAAVGALRAALAGAPEAQAPFEGGLRLAQLANPARERTKTNCVKVIHEMRLALRELGRRLVERGKLDELHQLFLLTSTELDAAVVWGRGEWQPGVVDFLAVVREREERYRSLFDLEPPFVARGTLPPTSEWTRRGVAGAPVAAVGDVLSGIAGSPGVAVGRARVVLDPGDPRGLEPGEVLVAPSTDPSWTPLFVPAAAVVVNVGAQITHAVIVSRELGLPCVVSVIGATERIPDGALVQVDGGAGTVTVLEGALVGRG